MASPILIAGGGIGGLAAALALSQKGFACSVLEQGTKFGEIGAGIQIGPNAFQMFKRLGDRRRDQRAHLFPEFLIMRDSTSGAELTRIAVGSRRFARGTSIRTASSTASTCITCCSKPVNGRR